MYPCALVRALGLWLVKVVAVYSVCTYGSPFVIGQSCHSVFCNACQQKWLYVNWYMLPQFWPYYIATNFCCGERGIF